MQKHKRTPATASRAYSDQQLVGLRTHAQTQKLITVERLAAAIASLNAEKKPISAKTIYDECGLAYASLRRNPEALLLYQQHSTFLKRERKSKKTSLPESLSPRDPLLAYKKTQLADRVRKERQRKEELEAQNATLLEVIVQKDIAIAELQAKLAAHEEYLGQRRAQLQRQEHQENDR